MSQIIVEQISAKVPSSTNTSCCTYPTLRCHSCLGTSASDLPSIRIAPLSGVINPKITAEGYKIGTRGFTNYILSADGNEKAGVFITRFCSGKCNCIFCFKSTGEKNGTDGSWVCVLFIGNSIIWSVRNDDSYIFY